jgi:hypothetical protein
VIQKRFYLAGKIGADNWRSTILQGQLAPFDPREGFPVSYRAVLGVLDYTGPYFVDMSHDLQSVSEHGVPSTGESSRHWDDMSDNEITRMFVVQYCFEAIERSDVVFAWIDRADAYGTLVELGFAASKQKTIWIASPGRFVDMWFAEEIAEQTCFSEGTARNALLSLLPENFRPRRVAIAPGLRFEILRRDDYRCQICGARAVDGEQLHIDHRTPVALGGTNDPSNLWTLCRTCNLGKGTRELIDPERVRSRIVAPRKYIGTDSNEA